MLARFCMPGDTRAEAVERVGVAVGWPGLRNAGEWEAADSWRLCYGGGVPREMALF